MRNIWAQDGGPLESRLRLSACRTLCGMTRPTGVGAVMLYVLIGIGIDLVEVSGTMQWSYFSLFQLFL